jgi:hypothetical protein
MYYLPKQLALNAWEVSNVDLICSHLGLSLSGPKQLTYSRLNSTCPVAAAPDKEVALMSYLGLSFSAPSKI